MVLLKNSTKNVGGNPSSGPSFEEEWIKEADKLLFTPTALILAIALSVLLTLAAVALIVSWLVVRYRERFISILVRFSGVVDSSGSPVAADDEVSWISERLSRKESHIQYSDHVMDITKESKSMRILEREGESFNEKSSLLGNSTQSGSNYLVKGKRDGYDYSLVSSIAQRGDSIENRACENGFPQTSYGTAVADLHGDQLKVERAQRLETVNGIASKSKQVVECASQHSSLSTKSPVSVFEPRGSTDRAALRHTNSSRYEIISRIGRGAFSCVYLVHRRSDACPFALKYLSCCSENERTVAVRECELLTLLQGHENIIRILDVIIKNELVEEEDDEQEDDECSQKASEHLHILQQQVQPAIIGVGGKTSSLSASNTSSNNKRHSHLASKRNTLTPDAMPSGLDKPTTVTTAFRTTVFPGAVNTVETAYYAPRHKKEPAQATTPHATPINAQCTLPFASFSRTPTPVPPLHQTPTLMTPLSLLNKVSPTAAVAKQDTNLFSRRLPKRPDSSSSSSSRSMQLTPFFSRPIGPSAGGNVAVPSPFCLGPSAVCSSVTSTNSTNVSRHAGAKIETASGAAKSSLHSSNIVSQTENQRSIKNEHSSVFSSDSEEEPLQPVFVGEKPLFRSFPVSELVTRGQVDVSKPLQLAPAAHLLPQSNEQSECSKEISADSSNQPEGERKEKHEPSHEVVRIGLGNGSKETEDLSEKKRMELKSSLEGRNETSVPAVSRGSPVERKDVNWREPWQPVRVRQSQESGTSIHAGAKNVDLPNGDLVSKGYSSFVEAERKVAEVDPFISPPVLRSVAYHRCPPSPSLTAAPPPSQNILSEDLRNRERDVSPSYVHHYTTTELLEMQDSKQRNMLSRSITSNTKTLTPTAVRTPSTESPHCEAHFHPGNFPTGTGEVFSQEKSKVNHEDNAHFGFLENKEQTSVSHPCPPWSNSVEMASVRGPAAPISTFLRSPNFCTGKESLAKAGPLTPCLAPTASTTVSQFTTQDTVGISHVMSSSSLQVSVHTEDKDLFTASGTSPSYITPSTPSSNMKNSGTVLPVQHFTTEQLLAIQEKKQQQQQQHSKNLDLQLLRHASQSLTSLTNGTKSVQYYRDPSSSIRYISSTVGTAVIPRSTPWRTGPSYAPGPPLLNGNRGELNNVANVGSGASRHPAVRNSNSYFYMRQPAYSQVEMIPIVSPIPGSAAAAFSPGSPGDGARQVSESSSSPLMKKEKVVEKENSTAGIHESDSSRSHLLIHSPHSLNHPSSTSIKTDADTGMSTTNWSVNNNANPQNVVPPSFLVRGAIVGESDYDNASMELSLRELLKGPGESSILNLAPNVQPIGKDVSFMGGGAPSPTGVEAGNIRPRVPSANCYSQESGQMGGIKTTTTRRCKKAKAYLCLIMDYHSMGDLCHYVQQQELRLQRTQWNASSNTASLNNNKAFEMPSNPTGNMSENRAGAHQEKHSYSSLNSSAVIGINGASPLCPTSSSSVIAPVASLVSPGSSNSVMAVTESQLLSIAYQMASALHFLHSQDPPIVHRDLKPENILIKGEKKELCGLSSSNMSLTLGDHQTPRGVHNPSSSSSQLTPSITSTGSTHQNLLSAGHNFKGGQAPITASYIPIVISDFGLAVQMQRKEDGTFVAAHRGGGTKPYMAPEVFTEGAIPASDIWSLGCVLYAIATGRLDRRSVKFMYREVQREDGFAAMVLNDILKKRYSLAFATFVVSLLVVDPKKRPTASLIQSYFLKKEKEVSFDLSSPFFSNVLDL